MSKMPSERRVNVDYIPTTHKIYYFTADGKKCILHIHCPNPYLAWAKEVRSPFLIPILYRKSDETKAQS